MSPSLPNVGENTSHEGTETEVVPAWKQELNERLAATRSRRLRNREEQVPLPGFGVTEHKAESRASRLAAKVAERYANAPSYSEVLAAEARSRAEVITTAALPVCDAPAILQKPSDKISPAADNSYEAEVMASQASTKAAVGSDYGEIESLSSEETEDEELSAGVEPLAVNLVDYPRELVAPRKARPRLAEGPLRTVDEAQQDLAQRKIFEVLPGRAAADWSPIRLDTEPVSSLKPGGLSHSEETPLQSAPLEDRVMAGIFDLALVVAAFAIFVLVFVACTAHPPTGKPALYGAGLVLVGFCLLYQYLFFKFATGTPGMRYAKIALCTFEDENPTRKAMCRRVLFLMLSAAPLGLGFAWAWFDPDRMGWHDRLSRIYQRSYS